MLGGARVRVLEPSPPAIVDEFFADDPVNTEPGGSGAIVSPVSNADARWVDHATADDAADFARENWLGPYKRLPSPPAALAATRLALHRVGAYVMSPARRRTNDKIALRYTRGGFGTPFYGEDEQIRTENGLLIHQVGDDVRSVPISSLNAVGDFIGAPPDVAWASQFDIPEPGGLDEVLSVDLEAAAFLGDWFGFAYSVLEELRADSASVEASRVQLWPEHFDPAFEMLADPRRASYGASPGDGAIDEPYLYVGPWSPADVPENEFWNTGFASIPLSEFVDAPDQRQVALDFYRHGRALLAA